MWLFLCVNVTRMFIDLMTNKLNYNVLSCRIYIINPLNLYHLFSVLKKITQCLLQLILKVGKWSSTLVCGDTRPMVKSQRLTLCQQFHGFFVCLFFLLFSLCFENKRGKKQKNKKTKQKKPIGK
jgi:uncharacterized membrane protein YhaH (DUF805 family)